MSQKEQTQRMTLVVTILIIALMFGISAMRCYIDELTATIAAKNAEIQARKSTTTHPVNITQT